MYRAIAAGLLCIAAAVGGPVRAAERGFLGFALRTDIEGSFWNPVLKTMAISVVAPGSATARSGIVVGDVVLELQDLAVPNAEGERLKQLKAQLDKPIAVGDQVRMRLRHADGQEYAVVLTAEPKK